MTEIVTASPRELSTSEILEIVNGGGRVIIEVSVLGRSMKMVIRKQGETYYCDTPMKLLTHETEEDIRQCLERYRLASPDEIEPTEPSTSSPINV